MNRQIIVEFLRSGPAIAIELARLNRNLSDLRELLADLRTMAADTLGWTVKGQGKAGSVEGDQHDV